MHQILKISVFLGSLLFSSQAVDTSQTHFYQKGTDKSNETEIPERGPYYIVREHDDEDNNYLYAKVSDTIDGLHGKNHSIVSCDMNTSIDSHHISSQRSLPVLECTDDRYDLQLNLTINENNGKITYTDALGKSATVQKDKNEKDEKTANQQHHANDVVKETYTFALDRHSVWFVVSILLVATGAIGLFTYCTCRRYLHNSTIKNDSDEHEFTKNKAVEGDNDTICCSEHDSSFDQRSIDINTSHFHDIDLTNEDAFDEYSNESEKRIQETKSSRSSWYSVIWKETSKSNKEKKKKKIEKENKKFSYNYQDFDSDRSTFYDIYDKE
jgi:hypothetical protein